MRVTKTSRLLFLSTMMSCGARLIIVKAMLWTETNPHALGNAWETAPLQSTNRGDLSWSYMMNNAAKMNLIVPPSLRNAVGSPDLNAVDKIAAGVGDLLYPTAEFGPKMEVDQKDIKTVIVNPGDSL